MAISNFIDTVSSSNIIRWNTFETYIVKDRDENKITKLGRDNAVAKKHCDYLSKYNEIELTKEEIVSFKKIKEDVNNKKETIGRILSDVKGIIKTKASQLEMKDFSLEKLDTKYRNELILEKDGFKEALRSESNHIIGKTRHLKHFRLQNNLTHRDADYPTSKVFFWGIFFVVLLLEAVANAYFYAQGSDLGLLGGVLQAFLVAVANVVLSFGIGFILFRYVNHISIVKNIFAWIGIVISFGILSFLHLVTAHYRELLIKFPDDATKKVLLDTWNNPFAISDMDSFILIIIGFTISIIVMWKSYHYDDVYPGYGQEWRKWIETEKKKDEHIKNYKKSVNKLVENFENDIDRLNNNIRISSEDFEKIISNLEGFYKTIAMYCDGIKDAAIGLSLLYRKGYNEVAEQEALLSNSVINDMIINFLGINEISKNISNIFGDAEHSKKVYLKLSGDIGSLKDETIMSIKSFKNAMIEDGAITLLMNEALLVAKKQQYDIGTL